MPPVPNPNPGPPANPGNPHGLPSHIAAVLSPAVQQELANHFKQTSDALEQAVRPLMSPMLPADQRDVVAALHAQFYRTLAAQRAKQMRKYSLAVDDGHTGNDWVALLMEYMAEAAGVLAFEDSPLVIDAPDDRAVADSLTMLAAMCLAVLEALERNDDGGDYMDILRQVEAAGWQL